MADSWLREWVWWDYRLALVLTLLVPFVLLLLSFRQSNRALRHTLIAYWRASSLLAITVYLMAAHNPLGYLTSWLARLMIVACLLYFAKMLPVQGETPVLQAFRLWRSGIVGYNLLGVLFITQFLGCAGQMPLSANCQIILEPPIQFTSLLHAGIAPANFSMAGLLGLGFYLLYFNYWLLVRRKQIKLD